MQICPKFHIASVSSDFKTTEIVRVFNKRYIIDTFSSHTLNEKLKIGIDFPSTLADSPTSLISRNSLTTACRRHKDRILRIHANGQQTINIRKRRSRCIPASLSISRQLFPRVRVSLFLETIPARMSWNQEEDYEQDTFYLGLAIGREYHRCWPVSIAKHGRLRKVDDIAIPPKRFMIFTRKSSV